MKDLTDPTNRDSVPAMLTPGEFVINKEATQLFGPQIEAMNNHGLRIRAAENKAVGLNAGGSLPTLPTATFNTGGLVTFLKDKEGWRSDAYQDDAKVWTIGYGRTTNDDGSAVIKGQTTDRKTENTWLDKRAGEELAAINSFAETHGYDWTDGQKNALASFRYNGGQGMIDQLTGYGKRDNATIQSKFGLYNKITNPDTGKKEFVQGLQNRRDAELELWGGTTPTKVESQPNVEVVPQQMEAPPQEAGFSDVSPSAAPAIDPTVPQDIPAGPMDPGVADEVPGIDPASFIPQLQGQPQINRAPNVMSTAPSQPEYIPLSAEGGVQRRDAEENPGWISRLRSKVGLNEGGQIPMQYLRGGGKVKAWNPNTLKFEFVTPEQAQVFAQQSSVGQLQEGITAPAPAAPMNFAKAAQIRAQSGNILQPTPGGRRGPAPYIPPGEYDPNPRLAGSPGDHLMNQIGLAGHSLSGLPPEIDQRPPAPPAPTYPNQAPAGGATPPTQGPVHEIGPQIGPAQEPQSWLAQQFAPLKGSLSNNWNERHPETAVNRPPPPELGSPPPIPGSDEALLQNSSQSVEEAEVVTDLTGLSEEEIGVLYDQGNPAAIAYAENQDQQWRTANDLNQQRLNLSTANPSTLGHAVASERADELQRNLAQLQSTPDGVQIAASGEIPQLHPVPQINDQAGAAWGKAQIPSELGTDFSGPAGGLDTGDLSVTPNFGADPRGEGTAAQKQSADVVVPTADEQAATAQSVVTKAVNEPPAPVTNSDELVAAGQAAVAADPVQRQQADSTIKEVFGELFDKKELIRMGIIFAGAIATGASPGRALAIAGTGYLQRLDAKASNQQKHIQDLVKGNKYDAASIKAYSDSGDPSMLIPKGVAPEELGNSKTFYGPNGRIQAREVKVGENKIWLDKNNKPVNLNTVHEDASRVQGTPEYRKRITDESKQLGATFKDMQERFGKFSTKDGDAYTTDLIPGKVGTNAAKWAIDNDVPPEAMGQLLDNAYQQALLESKDGKRVRSISAYLNDQYIQAQVGDPSLFQTRSGETVSAEKVDGLITTIAAVTNLPGSKSNQATIIMQKARPYWNDLEADVKKSYNRRAGPGQSGFMVYLQDQLKTLVK